MNLFERVMSKLRERPHWMNAILLFCAFMTFIYLPWDVFIKPLAEDQEVWFGILFTGWAAKAGALLHWFVYGAGTVGFWNMKKWMHPWASLYTLQIALGMFVWSLLSGGELSLLASSIVAIPFLLLGIALWRSKAKFSH